jgi:hypothetical protein
VKCVVCLFLLAMVLSVLLFTVSDYPFGIFKLFKLKAITMLITSYVIKRIMNSCINYVHKKSFFKKQQNIFVDMRDVFLRNIRENTNKNNYNFETNDDYFVCPRFKPPFLTYIILQG